MTLIKTPNRIPIPMCLPCQENQGIKAADCRCHHVRRYYEEEFTEEEMDDEFDSDYFDSDYHLDEHEECRICVACDDCLHYCQHCQDCLEDICICDDEEEDL